MTTQCLWRVVKVSTIDCIYITSSLPGHDNTNCVHILHPHICAITQDGNNKENSSFKIRIDFTIRKILFIPINIGWIECYEKCITWKGLGLWKILNHNIVLFNLFRFYFYLTLKRVAAYSCAYRNIQIKDFWSKGIYVKRGIVVKRKRAVQSSVHHFLCRI